MSTFQNAGRFYEPDYFYGEIYECTGEYWAEVIVVLDGIESVPMTSPIVASRAEAESWLVQQGVEKPLSLAQQIKAAVAGLFAKRGEVATGQGVDMFCRNLNAA